MPKVIFKNNAQSSLAGGIGPFAVTAQLQAGTGVMFASPQPGEHFVGTFVDAATGLVNEIVWVTNVTGDVITMARGQEGTEAKTWQPNDAFAELWTAGQAGYMLQQGDEQSGASSFGVDSGVANAYSTVLNPALVANTPGQAFRIKILNTNTGASTVNFGVGATPIRNAQGLPLSGGELVAGYVYEMYWNGATYNLPMAALVSIPTGMIAPYGGGAVPAGWLACIGQSVSKDVYPALFAVIGTLYGGNGLPNFNLPDLRGRVPAGLDGGVGRLSNTYVPNASGSGGAGSNAMGGWGGAQDVALSIAQLAAHSHTLNEGAGHGHGYSDPQHRHYVDLPEGAYAGGGSGGYQPGLNLGNMTPSVWSRYDYSGITISANTTGVWASNTGSGSAHSNVQPTLMILYMIKT